MNWTKKQIKRFNLLLVLEQEGKVKIGYWCSDSLGCPANGGTSADGLFAKPGLIQKVEGPLEICTSSALHITSDPLRWRGSRVWICALHGEVQNEADKSASLKREIIGEVLPEDCVCNPRIGARLGRKDLAGANLTGANLSGADLSRADLAGAILTEADLYGANLTGANLRGADLSGADLRRANLTEAKLSEADLTGANFSGADLTGGFLFVANLTVADFTGAFLGS